MNPLRQPRELPNGPLGQENRVAPTVRSGGQIAALVSEMD